MSLIEAPDPQQLAANPALSAVVRANAGSGKTKTLVDRVARLLLRGAKPETILCMTYTKAGASEMQRRLFAQLGGWAVEADEGLVSALARLEGRNVSDYDRDALSAARRLFAQALETPGGLKIQTIHAFCEKLLRQFPLEAGVNPGFTVLDDVSAAEVAARAREAIAAQAADPDGFLGGVYARLSVKLDWQAFESLFASLATYRDAIMAYAARGELAQSVADSLGQPTLRDPDEVEALAFAAPAFSADAYFAAARDLAASPNVTDQKSGLILQAAAEQARSSLVDPAPVWKLFFTAEGEPRRSNFPTSKAAPQVTDWIAKEQARLTEALEALRAARIGRDTFDVLALGLTYARAYEGAKADAAALDFADLITKTRALLTDRPSAAWVLFKLDGGVDHLLVDEAQDTAPDQWDIVRALTAEFFAGEESRPRSLDRTVFVVGDEKQSIFSFQGAAPQLLAQQAQAFQSMIEGVGRDFRGIELTVSWRSTRQVLAFVDQVFEGPERSAALSPGGGDSPETPVIRHAAKRSTDPGTVDLWPLVQEAPAQLRRAWDDPVDLGATGGAWRRLAVRIATECKALVERGDQVGEGLSGRLRPAGYGDILVLVRKRGPLFEETLRELKRLNVPVAGADQLKLSQHIVFDDLVALARYALFPWDDLTLAELLRSPLCDLSETDLFDLAHGRRGSLFATLNARNAERPTFAWAMKLLGRARDLAQKVPPFEFYSRLLCSADDQGRSLRQRFITRIGPEAGEALDAFLAQALNAEQRGVRDLERFCASLEKLDVTLKRELDEPRGEVRVMTAHGAKGLEAPIVFLADTVFGGPPRAPFLPLEQGGFLWLGAREDDCRAARAAHTARQKKEEDELQRLLYVGLTRARDRLVLGGRISAKAKPENIKGWLPHLRDAFELRLEGLRELEDPQGFTFQRYGDDPARGAAASAVEAAASAPPDWIAARPGDEPAGHQYASPSTYADSRRGSTPSPLAASGGLGRFRRGDLIHRLFELLPDLAATDQAEAAERILAKERDLTPEQRREMIQATLGVLHDPRFAEVFGPGSRPEAAVAGAAPDMPPGLAISGRVDRMLVQPDRVLVVDFKTNRPAPDRIDNADPAYIAQMALYAAVLREIFPGRRVEAALVWTDGPKLMPVPENLMAASLAGLRRSG